MDPISNKSAQLRTVRRINQSEKGQTDDQLTKMTMVPANWSPNLVDTTLSV